MNVRKARSRLGLATVVAASAIVPASAFGAEAVSDYHPDENARSFRTNAAGWEASSQTFGFCLGTLTCPEATNTFEATGGARGAGDGHIRTAFASTSGVGGTSQGTWRSPAFAYRGAGGQEATEVEFRLSKRADTATMLAAAGNSVTYSVELVDLDDGGNAVGVLENAPLAPTEGWVRTRGTGVDERDLETNHRYRIRLTTTYAYGAQVVPGGSVDYDDVRLRALRDENGDGDGDDGAGGGGGGGGAGNGGAVLKGKNLFLKLKCLGVARSGKCKVRATALMSKRGSRVTFPIQRKVRAKKGKVVRMRVRPRFVNQLQKQDRVLVRSKVRAGEKRKVRYKRYRLIKR